MLFCFTSTTVLTPSAFNRASVFNGDLSKWNVAAVTIMANTFYAAKAFNFKSTLDIEWKIKNPSVYPGTNMYHDTCSSDSSCGNCGKKNTGGDAVTCSSSVQPTKATSTSCTFCADNLRECCTLPMCAVTDGSTMNTAGTNCQCGTSDCTASTGMFCQSNTCHTSAFGSAALPDGTGTASSPGTGLRKVVSDWIGGGDLKNTVITTYGSIEDWQVSGVTNLKYVFYYKTTFNADLSKWNVAAVTTLYGSTYNSTSFLSSLFIQ